jgi:hypothetical protein
MNFLQAPCTFTLQLQDTTHARAHAHTHPSNKLQPCYSNFDGSVSNIHRTALTSNQVTVIFFLLALLKKHLGGHRFQNVAEVQETVVRWYLWQSPELRTGTNINVPRISRSGVCGFSIDTGSHCTCAEWQSRGCARDMRRRYLLSE